MVFLHSLAYAQKPEIAVQLGHRSNVTSVAISSDGRYLVTGSYDDKAKLWDVNTGKEIRVFSGHSGPVKSVAISSDGRYLVTGSEDKTAKLWDVRSGKEIRVFSGHSGPVNSVAIGSDVRYVMTGSSGATAKLWDLKSGKEIRTFSGNSDWSSSVVFSSDGRYIVIGGDNTAKLRDMKSGKGIQTFSGHSAIVISAAISSDGRYVVTGSRDKTAKLWDVKSGKEIRTFSGHSYIVTAVAISSDGQYVVTVSLGATAKLWDVRSGKEIRSFSRYSQGITDPQSVAISSDGRYIVIGGDNTAKLWDAKGGEDLRTFSGHSLPISSVATSSDGRYVVTGSDDNTAKLWDMNSAKLIRTFSDVHSGPNSQVISVAMSTDGQYVLTGNFDQSTKLWDVVTGKVTRKFGERAAGSVAISSDGLYVVTGSDLGNNDQTATFWDVSRGQMIRVLSGQWGVSSVATRSDGRYVATGSWNMAFLWDVISGEQIRKFSGHSSSVTSIALSSDGRYVVTGSGDKTAKLWDISSGKEIRTFSGHSLSVTSVAISSDGRYVVTGSDDQTVNLWDVRSGEVIRVFSGHSEPVNSVAISSDGQYIASGGRDGTLRLWNIMTGEWVAFMANPDGTQWLAFTDDGYWDASRNGGDLVATVRGMECWNIDQFAVRNNRPDIILRKLGSKDTALIDHYHYQYLRRLRRLGFVNDKGEPDESFLSGDYYLPESKILEAKQQDKFVDLKLRFDDGKCDLKLYSIYVNDVALFGAYGKEISGRSKTIQERIELTYGTNKIEVSCTNEKGGESYRALTYANFNEKTNGNLYFIGFGVSRYKDKSLNLKYADKDVTDLAEVFRKMGGLAFSNVYVKTYTNEEATVENVKKAKELLRNSRVDDTFVLFIAGHGMHDRDKQATYYFLTCDAKLDELATTAASFDLFEDLLQGISPRNKLFLMDACESGELEEGAETQYLALASSRGLKARTINRGFKIVEEKAMTTTMRPRPYLLEKDRYIYNDLSRRSGAVVFSSSKGTEFSYELDSLQNGLFTKEIINALTYTSVDTTQKNVFWFRNAQPRTKADKNADGITSTDELRDYVGAAVSRLSGDLQHPTVDRDNIYQKFGFGIAVQKQ